MQFDTIMSPRTKKLYDLLIERAQGNRSGEWFNDEMFPQFEGVDVTQYGLDGEIETKTILIRRAIAIDIMLKAMTDEKNSESTHTAEIAEGDLLLGVLPMGSNGLGKVFPQFMTDSELRAGSITNRNTASLFGHNSMDYNDLLRHGLKKIIADCDEKIETYNQIQAKADKVNDRLNVLDMIDQDNQTAQDIYGVKTQKDFYTSVKIACQSVIDYAHRFAKIARREAEKYEQGSPRWSELSEMAKIAEKVPENAADNFHEAMQSITFFHIALHASMNLISLGRLDQVLQPYLQSENNKARALEIFECFLIKLAGRLNLSSDYLIEQDHVDYATVLGTHPYYIDQKAGVNNFLQNIIIGGKTPDGSDATTGVTYLILQAFANVNLSTPGIYVRIHKNSPAELISAIAVTLNRTKNNPAILNDETMIPAMYRALMQNDWAEAQSPNPRQEIAEKSKIMQSLANDYCVDGCWEPILNCKSDWTFTMPNAMAALETAINRGASLLPDAEMFRGAKIAPVIPLPTNFKELLDAYKKQLGFFTDQCALSMFLYYMIDEYAAPSPLFSAYLSGCMENGRDKAWGGAQYNLAGLIFGGIPNVVNTLAAIRKWVFPQDGKGKYTLDDVANAFRFNFTCDDPSQEALKEKYLSIQNDFDNNTQKFGNNDSEVDSLTKQIVDIIYEVSMDSAKFAKKIYQDKPASEEEWKNVIALRRLTGYYGETLSRKFDNFQMRFTVGMGTFEQYNWQGRGIAASADRGRGEPLAPNFSPAPGTTRRGAVGLLKSFENLGIDRFAGGVISDICLEEQTADIDVLEKLLTMAVNHNAPMLTVSIGSEKRYREIYEKVIIANNIADKKEAAKILAPYAGVNVRIGGWQTPFITLPISHMENYIHRPTVYKSERG